MEKIKRIIFVSTLKLFLMMSVCNNHSIFAQSKSKKIVGLLQIRNESVLIEQCLHALSFYTDAMVILDDASQDDTVKLCKECAHTYRIEAILQNESSAWEHRSESDNRQKLLEAGRTIGGTHFIILDADEIMTANCKDNNFLRRMILQLNPGDRLAMNIMHVWDSLHRYRTYFSEKMKFFIFCDDGACSYLNQFLHVNRTPFNLQGGVNLELPNDQYGLLHFGYYNWQNVLIKQAWYKCLERIRNPQKSVAEINSWYPAHKEKDLQTLSVPSNWIMGYDFFNPSLFDHVETWRKKQMKQWFEKYGKEYFKELEIWHLNWDEIFMEIDEKA